MNHVLVVDDDRVTRHLLKSVLGTAGFTAGMAIVLHPTLSLVMGVVFALTVAVTRRGSVGSLVLAVLLPIGVAVSGHRGTEVLMTAGVSLVVIARHHDNIRRLIRREETPVRPAGEEP